MDKTKRERETTKRDSGKKALTLAAGIAALSVSIGVDVDDVLAAAVEAPAAPVEAKQAKLPPVQQLPAVQSKFDPAAPVPAFESIKGQTAPAVGPQSEGIKAQTVPSGNVGDDIGKAKVAPSQLPAQQSKDRVVRERNVPESRDGGAQHE